jgi:hypothetical protein
MGLAYPVIENVALAGAVAGYQSGRQPIIDAAGVAVEPADFVVPVEAASNYTVNQQAAIYAAPLPTAIPGYVSSLINAGATAVPANALGANAAQSLPVLLAVLAASIFDGRSIPLNAAGNPAQAGFFPPLSNSVAAMFQLAVGAFSQL